MTSQLASGLQAFMIHDELSGVLPSVGPLALASSRISMSSKRCGSRLARNTSSSWGSLSAIAQTLSRRGGALTGALTAAGAVVFTPGGAAGAIWGATRAVSASQMT